MLSYDGNHFLGRRISADPSTRENNLLTINNTKSYDKGMSPLNGFRNVEGRHDVKKESFYSSNNFEMHMFEKPSENFERKMRERGITTDKRPVGINHSPSIKSI